eukprot:gene15576-21674_t
MQRERRRRSGSGVAARGGKEVETLAKDEERRRERELKKLRLRPCSVLEPGSEMSESESDDDSSSDASSDSSWDSSSFGSSILLPLHSSIHSSDEDSIVVDASAGQGTLKLSPEVLAVLEQAESSAAIITEDASSETAEQLPAGEAWSLRAVAAALMRAGWSVSAAWMRIQLWSMRVLVSAGEGTLKLSPEVLTVLEQAESDAVIITEDACSETAKQLLAGVAWSLRKPLDLQLIKGGMDRTHSGGMGNQHLGDIITIKEIEEEDALPNLDLIFPAPPPGSSPEGVSAHNNFFHQPDGDRRSPSHRQLSLPKGHALAPRTLPKLDVDSLLAFDMLYQASRCTLAPPTSPRGGHHPEFICLKITKPARHRRSEHEKPSKVLPSRAEVQARQQEVGELLGTLATTAGDRMVANIVAKRRQGRKPQATRGRKINWDETVRCASQPASQLAKAEKPEDWQHPGFQASTHAPR